MICEDSKSIGIEIMGKQHQMSWPAEQVGGLNQAAIKLSDMCVDIKKNLETVTVSVLY